ncbi:MAG: sigma-70 family RNA polymerase sigma factor [Desulfobacterales bacterium]|nr:sigma-70 family RNA polymerase sigma factor [Desulfobacterales bacterium]
MPQNHLTKPSGKDTGSRNTVSAAGPAPIDEAALIERLRKGQQWACNMLVSLYQERLLRIAYGITLDHGESQEIVQDVFLKAMGSIHGFRGDSGLWTWLRKITVNHCLNWKRKWKRRFKWHHTSLETDTEFLVYDEAVKGETPETRLREKQEEASLAEAVRSLPEKIRVAFVLSTIEGLSYKEISQTLGIKEGTVSSRLHRARQMILENLEKQNKDKGGTP